jgi:hypothetical protein
MSIAAQLPILCAVTGSFKLVAASIGGFRFPLCMCQSCGQVVELRLPYERILERHASVELMQLIKLAIRRVFASLFPTS